VTAGDLDLPVLADGVVYLRPFAPTDAAALADIWTDPTIRARNTVPEPAEDAALQWIAGHVAKAASAESWEWALVDAETDRLAGRRALKNINWGQGRASAACWVAPEFRAASFAEMFGLLADDLANASAFRSS
jgi:RimJ/RimL family protein N-acetyltransferase